MVKTWIKQWGIGLSLYFGWWQQTTYWWLLAAEEWKGHQKLGSLQDIFMACWSPMLADQSSRPWKVSNWSLTPAELVTVWLSFARQTKYVDFGEIKVAGHFGINHAQLMPQGVCSSRSRAKVPNKKHGWDCLAVSTVIGKNWKVSGLVNLSICNCQELGLENSTRNQSSCLSTTCKDVQLLVIWNGCCSF